MTKIQCKFCEKEKDSFCSAKRVGVALNKKRVCHKFIESKEKVLAEEKRKARSKPIPMYKQTFRYYEKLLNGFTTDKEGSDYVKVR